MSDIWPGSSQVVMNNDKILTTIYDDPITKIYSRVTYFLLRPDTDDPQPYLSEDFYIDGNTWRFFYRNSSEEYVMIFTLYTRNSITLFGYWQVTEENGTMKKYTFGDKNVVVYSTNDVFPNVNLQRTFWDEIGLVYWNHDFTVLSVIDFDSTVRKDDKNGNTITKKMVVNNNDYHDQSNQWWFYLEDIVDTIDIEYIQCPYQVFFENKLINITSNNPEKFVVTNIFPELPENTISQGDGSFSIIPLQPIEHLEYVFCDIKLDTNEKPNVILELNKGPISVYGIPSGMTIKNNLDEFLELSAIYAINTYHIYGNWTYVDDREYQWDSMPFWSSQVLKVEFDYDLRAVPVYEYEIKNDKFCILRDNLVLEHDTYFERLECGYGSYFVPTLPILFKNLTITGHSVLHAENVILEIEGRLELQQGSTISAKMVAQSISTASIIENTLIIPRIEILGSGTVVIVHLEDNSDEIDAVVVENIIVIDGCDWNIYLEKGGEYLNVDEITIRGYTTMYGQWKAENGYVKFGNKKVRTSSSTVIVKRLSDKDKYIYSALVKYVDDEEMEIEYTENSVNCTIVGYNIHSGSTFSEYSFSRDLPRSHMIYNGMKITSDSTVDLSYFKSTIKGNIIVEEGSTLKADHLTIL